LQGYPHRRGSGGGRGGLRPFGRGGGQWWA